MGECREHGKAAAGLEPVFDGQFAYRKGLEEVLPGCQILSADMSEDRVFQKVLSTLNDHHCSPFTKEMLVPSATSSSQSSVCSEVLVADKCGTCGACVGEQRPSEQGIICITYQ